MAERTYPLNPVTEAELILNNERAAPPASPDDFPAGYEQPQPVAAPALREDRTVREKQSPPSEPLWRDALGEHLRRVRRERGETLTETADRAGISPQYLSEIERGRKEPSSEMIAAVAGALGTTLGDLTFAVAERLLLDRSVVSRAVAARTDAGRSVANGTVVNRAANPSGPVCRAAYALAA